MQNTTSFRTDRPSLNGDLLIDLETIPQERRASEWSQWVSLAFDGLRVESLSRTPSGFVRRVPLGPASISQILVTTQSLRMPAPSSTNAILKCGLMVQVEGSTEVAQQDRACCMRAGDIYLMDGASEFRIDAVGMSHVILVYFPRYQAEASFPELLRSSALPIGRGRAEAGLLHRLLTDLLSCGPALTSGGQVAAIAAVLKLVACLPVHLGDTERTLTWRVRKGVDDIEAFIDSASLNADFIAERQKVSRRRLDALFCEETGMTIAAQIHERRLAQAATELRKLTKPLRTVIDIAYSAGFQDAAHFTRAFRRRFGQSPTEWRRNALCSSASSSAPTISAQDRD